MGIEQNPRPLGCARPVKVFTATRTVTAQCPAGTIGDPVIVTRVGRSGVSEAHAAQLAIECARKEAEAELHCYFVATQCVQTECGSSVIDIELCRDGYSTASFTAAQQAALALAQAAAAEYCVAGIEPAPPFPPT